MKENYQIYLPYQFRLRDQSAGRDPQLPHKKMKTMFLSNMSKSRRLTSTFFPIIAYNLYYGTNHNDIQCLTLIESNPNLSQYHSFFSIIFLGPLHLCDIHGSKMAGSRLSDAMSLGASRPWRQTMEVLLGFGKTQFDTTAMLKFFRPLELWLDKQLERSN